MNTDTATPATDRSHADHSTAALSARPKRSGTDVRSPAHIRRSARGEDGLTTLEWLLIVAAVAGLAALAVVLVQNVVDDTAEQLGGASARATAANVAADTVIREARTASPDDARYNTWQRWELYFTARCERLEILYSDTNLDVEATFKRPTGKGDNDPTASADLNKADTNPPAAGKPQAICRRSI